MPSSTSGSRTSPRRPSPERFEEFTTRYRAELDENPAVEQLLEIVRSSDAVTMLYAAADTEHNGAVVLRDAVKAALSEA